MLGLIGRIRSACRNEQANIMHRVLICVATVLLAGPTARAEPTELIVETDFPGGSAEVERIDQEERVIRLRPTVHEDRGWDCWWYFKLRGITPGEEIALNRNPLSGGN